MNPYLDEDTMPAAPSGKIQKFELRAMLRDGTL